MPESNDRQKAEDHYYAALDLMADGHLEKAVAAYQESLTADPTFTEAMHGLARALQDLQRYDEAIAVAQRLAELGGETRARITDDGRKYTAYLGDASIPENEKLLSFTKRVGKPEDAIKPICEFANLLKEDLSTKEALRLFAEDELSTAKWIWDACAALNAPKQHESSASASM